MKGSVVLKLKRKMVISSLVGLGSFATVAGLCMTNKELVATGLQKAAYPVVTWQQMASATKTASVQSLSSMKKQKEGVTIHFKWSDSQPHVSYQHNQTKETSSFPGVPMRDEGNGWYAVTVPTEDSLQMVISVPEKDYQTTDFTKEPGEYWYDLDTGWAETAPVGYELPEHTTTPKETTAPVRTLVEKDVDAVQNMTDSKIIVHYPVGQFEKEQIYCWNALPQDVEMVWPGQEMITEGQYATYTIDHANKVNFLITDGKKQSEDFTIKNAGEYWFVNGSWTTDRPADVIQPTSEPDTPGVSEQPTVTKAPVVVQPGTGKTASFADSRTDFRDESIYFLMTTRFFDGDSGNNARGDQDNKVGNPDSDPSWRGDFKGLIEKLDYIKALGFTSIWITPVVENRSTSGYDYHGYHAYNFKKVDNRYLSSGVSYQDVIDACHKKGIKIIQDIVLNHSGGYGEENLQTFSNNDEATISSQDHNGYYNHSYIKSWESYDCQVTSIDGDCLDLNTENPVVIKYLEDAYDQYINMGVDGFRIDTTKHISRLTFNKEFLPHFQATARAAGCPNFYMYGEVCARDENALYFNNFASLSAFFYTWAENNTYAWGDTATNQASVKAHWDKYSDYPAEKAKAEFNSDNAILKGNNYHQPDYSKSSGFGVIDFPMHWAFRDANNAYNRALQDDAYYNDATWNVVYVDSHDYAPNTMEKLRYTGSTENWAENMDLMFTFRGIPCIYYGSEIEFKKGKPIDGYDKKIDETGRAYFGDHIEGSVTATDFGVYTASGAVNDTLNYPLALHVQTLNRIRQAVPALRKGQYSTENCSGNMAFKRRYTDDNMDSFACVAISGDASFSGLPGGTYTDCVTGDVQQVAEGGTLSVKCSGAANLRVYVLDTAKTKAPGKVGNGSAYMK